MIRLQANILRDDNVSSYHILVDPRIRDACKAARPPDEAERVLKRQYDCKFDDVCATY